MDTRIFKASDSYLEPALEVLRRGGIIISPTTTNYNILCNAANAKAVARVFEVKQRTKLGPLPVSMPYPHYADRYVYLPEWFDRRILEKLLPGEISFVFWQKYPFPDQLTCGLKTVAVSVTTNPVMRSIVKGMDGPVAATSANKSGQPSVFVSLEKAIADLGDEVDLIIDAGPTEAEAAEWHPDRVNTIIDLTLDKPWLVRKGWVSLEQALKFFPNLETDIHAYRELLMKRASDSGIRNNI